MMLLDHPGVIQWVQCHSGSWHSPVWRFRVRMQGSTHTLCLSPSHTLTLCLAQLYDEPESLYWMVLIGPAPDQTGNPAQHSQHESGSLCFHV